MEAKGIKVSKLVNNTNLTVISGEEYLDNIISVEMINRPQVELCGIFDYMDNQRLIVIGVKEVLLLDSYKKDKKEKIIDTLMSKRPPAVILSGNEEVSRVVELFKKFATKYHVPVLQSILKTTPLTGKLYDYLREHVVKPYSEHGVLLDVYGLGALIIGDSAVGKSETALELIKKGHILIADDLVEIREQTQGNIIGSAPQILRRYLEIRGIGIVDVISMFGASSYREKKRIKLVIALEKWDANKEYDRLGLMDESVTYFNTKIPKITIPVLPGRNVASLVESAVLNQKLKNLGYNAALNFTEKIAKKAQGQGDEDDD